MISQISSVSFLVYTLLCVGSWSTDSLGCGPKNWGSVTMSGVSGGCKISLSATQTPIHQKRPNLEFHIFDPLCTVPPRVHASFAPLPPQLNTQTKPLLLATSRQHTRVQ